MRDNNRKDDDADDCAAVLNRNAQPQRSTATLNHHAQLQTLNRNDHHAVDDRFRVDALFEQPSAHHVCGCTHTQQTAQHKQGKQAVNSAVHSEESCWLLVVDLDLNLQC